MLAETPADGYSPIPQQISRDRFTFVSCESRFDIHHSNRTDFVERPGSWEHFGSAMRYLDFHSHYKFWGFVGAIVDCAGGVLMILGLFFRIGVLFAFVVTLVHLVAVWHSRGEFLVRLPAFEMSILLISLLFIGPGKYSVDKN